MAMIIFPRYSHNLICASLMAVALGPAQILGQSVTPVALPNGAAAGGGSYGGIDFSYPVTASDGSVFFKDSSVPTTVGFPNSLQSLDVRASTIAGLDLASEQSLTLSALTFLAKSASGSYLINVGLAPASAGSVIVAGAPGNFTKILKSGDVLPGTTVPWPALRFSPSFFSPTIGVTRAGQPIIETQSADDLTGYIGIYRGGMWEVTQKLGVNVPGFPVGSRFRPGTSLTSDIIGNANGQFLYNDTVWNGATISASPLNQAAFLGQNGTMQLIVKSNDVLPGDSRRIGSPKASSINDDGTVALSGTYPSSTGAGWVYRWSAAGGLSKVIAEGDPLPSVGPRAVFTGTNGFQFPLINSSGALLFMGEVNVSGNRDSSIGRRLTLLYQSGPGAAVEMVVQHGSSVQGLPAGAVLGINNTDVLTFNDAGQFSLNTLSSSPLNTGAAVATLVGGQAPGASVIVRVGTPLNVEGRVGSSVFSSMISVPTVKSGQVAGEFNSTLSSGGDIYFRAVLTGAGGFFGQSGVFRAQLNTAPTGVLARQTISFANPQDVVVNSPSLTLSASSSSGLPVSFSLVSGPATLAGNRLSFSASTGEILVRASQAGDASFLAAESVERKFKVVATAASLPSVSSSAITPIALPGFSAPGGGSYSGVDDESPQILAGGAVLFKDAITGVVVGGGDSPTRLNLYSSAVSGLVLNAGERLDRPNPTVLGRSAVGNYFFRVPIYSANAPNSFPTESLTQECLVSGTPGNFTKILRTGEVLPGTTSVWSRNFGDNFPKTTSAGDPIIYARSPDGLTSHVGVYRNSAWEITQIMGSVPPGYGSNVRFAETVRCGAANRNGQFLFTAPLTTGTSSLRQTPIFIAQNGTKQLITINTNTTIGGDPRTIADANAASLNNSGTALIFGTYNQVSGNANQGGFLYRWSSAGGFVKVAARGDLLPGISQTAKFYSATYEPLINDNGAVLFFASVDLLGTGVNNTSALLYQSAPGAVIEKVALASEYANDVFNSRFADFNSLHFNDAGQFALFTQATNATGPHSVIYGGTAPSIAKIAGGGFSYIEGVSGAKSFATFVSSFPNQGPIEINSVAGEYGSKLSNNGLIAFRSSYSGIGVTNNDTGVFVANLTAAPAPVPVAQSISFPSPSDQLVNGSFTPAGTSTSGLTITYQVISGPASVSGNNVVLSGTPGLVTIRASQSGNAAFLAAAPLERSFRVVASSAELALVNYLSLANVPATDRLGSLDLDNDHLSNLLEFALGGHPLLPDSRRLPAASLLNGQLRFVYTRAQPGSLNYVVTVTNDLAAGWSIDGVNQGTTGGDGQTVATIPLSGSSRFLRLEVSLKP
jgi:hypothetical protein